MLQQPTLRDRFPGLSGLPRSVSARLDACARSVSMTRGTVIFAPGKPSANLMLLASGTVRVLQSCAAGQRTVRYPAQSGQCCALTTACMLAFGEPAAEGIAETDIEAVLIPRDTFVGMITASRDLRAFLFGVWSRRVADLCLEIEERFVARTDIRDHGSATNLHLTLERNMT